MSVLPEERLLDVILVGPVSMALRFFHSAGGHSIAAMPRMSRWVLAATWICGLSVAGCVKPTSVTCDEVVCPRDTMCNERFGCVTSVQAEVCEGQTDGTPCSYTGVEHGVCGSGICTPAGCGNGVIDADNGEDCDGTAIGETTCEDLGAYAGTLTCTSSCRFDTSTCGGYCGDGITQDSEQCDGTVPTGTDCTNARTPGFYGGTLGCLPNCKFDYSECAGTCGDGAKTANEACDGSDFGGDGCQAHGYYTGVLGCSADCQTVTDTACSGQCGDGTLDGTELCDASNLGDFTCESIGFYSTGNKLPVCNSTCNGVTKGTCDGYCGDGVVNGNELCDGLQQNDSACAGFGAMAGALGCDALCQRTFDACIYDATLAPIGASQAFQINDIVAFGPHDMWTVGYDGLYHGDGAHWVKDPLDSTSLVALYGRAADDVWAVGGGLGVPAKVYHYDGTTWTSLDASISGALSSVWASGASDAWFAGLITAGNVLRYNGSTFSLVPTGSSTFQLSSIWGSGMNDVWFGGYDSSDSTGVLLQWTGTGFASPIHLPNGATVTGLWGSASNDVWASTTGGVYHYAGASWTQLSSFYSQDIDGTAADDIWVVGGNGLAEHYDGSIWAPVSSGVTASLFAVTAAGRGDAWTAGAGGTIAHFSGQTWTQDAFSAGQRLDAMIGFAADDIWAVGSGGTIVHYDGSQWAAATSPTTFELLDIWGAAADDIWAVGLSGSSGVLLHYNGSSWSTSQTVGANLWAVHGSGANDVWATGTGIAMHYTGSWTTITPAPSTRTIGSVWAMSPTEAYAFTNGLGGRFMMTWNGSTWSAESFLTKFGGPWGATPGDMWISTAAGQVGMGHLNANGSFDSVPAPGTAALSPIWGVASDDIWAGPGPYHFDGASWSTAKAPTAMLKDGVNAFWGAASNDVWAVTGSGTIYHWTGTFDRSGGGATCGDVVPLYCGSVLTSTYAGSTANHASRLASYTCGTRDAVGPETIYRLDTPLSGDVELTLTPVTGDLDLVVLGERPSGLGCDPSQCLAASQTAGSGAEMLVRTATKGETLFVVVDSVTAVPAAYSLKVECTKSTSM